MQIPRKEDKFLEKLLSAKKNRIAEERKFELSTHLIPENTFQMINKVLDQQKRHKSIEPTPRRVILPHSQRVAATPALSPKREDFPRSR